jgi:sterol-4alpha-carboxylate 3-dehydrogenase (decarboxylating)
MDSNRKHGVLTTSIRPAGTFGEGDTEMMDKLLAVARSGRANVQMGGGKNVYDFLYVGNLVHAHFLAAAALLRASALAEDEIKEEERVDGEVFHVTNDEPWLFWDFTRAVAKEAGFPVRDEDLKVIPRWVGMLLAFFAEWFVWIFSMGRKQSNLTRYGVRYSCITRTLNIDKAKKMLRYRPIVGMQEGLERTVRWFQENGKKDL